MLLLLLLLYNVVKLIELASAAAASASVAQVVVVRQPSAGSAELFSSAHYFVLQSCDIACLFHQLVSAPPFPSPAAAVPLFPRLQFGGGACETELDEGLPPTCAKMPANPPD